MEQPVLNEIMQKNDESYEKCKYCNSRLEERDNQYICTNCGKTYEMISSNSNGQFLAEIPPNPEKNKTDNFTRVCLTISLVSVLFFVVSMFALKITNVTKAKNEYIQSAQEEYDVILSNFGEADYDGAIINMKDYERSYKSTDTYYNKLPDSLVPEKQFPKLKEQIANNLVTVSSGLYEKLDAKDDITYSADYSNIVVLEQYLRILNDNYDYLNIRNQPKKSIEEKLDNCRFTKALVLYNHGEKAEGINILKNLNGKGNLNSQLKQAVPTMLNKMIASNPATNFRIISGSKEVSVYPNGRNYGWTCPYCGYSTIAVGTTSIYSELNQHYAGEVSTMPGMMFCAGKWIGGCGQSSQYTLTIEYQ